MKDGLITVIILFLAFYLVTGGSVLGSMVANMEIDSQKTAKQQTIQIPTDKIDYQIIINKDSIKLLDMNNKVIYKDTFNWSNPSKLETAIIKDNL